MATRTSISTKATGTAEATTPVLQWTSTQFLDDIQSTDYQIRLGSPFIETYGESSQQSYTVFFVVPPGGQQSTFHVTLKLM